MNKLGSFCLMLLSIFLFNCSEENEEVAPITKNYIGLEVGDENYEWEDDLVTSYLDRTQGFFLITGVNVSTLNTVQIYVFTDGEIPQSGETYEYLETSAQDSGSRLSFANLILGTLGFSTLALTASSPTQKEKVGQVTFTEVTTNRCKGTFNFKMANVGGIITIEKGEFDTSIQN